MKKILAKKELIFYLYVMGKLNKGRTLTYEEAQFLVDMNDEELFVENPDVVEELNKEEANTYRNNLEELKKYLELKELSHFSDSDNIDFEVVEGINKIIR